MEPRHISSLSMNTGSNSWNFRSQSHRGRREDASLSNHLPPTQPAFTPYKEKSVSIMSSMNLGM